MRGRTTLFARAFLVMLTLWGPVIIRRTTAAETQVREFAETVADRIESRLGNQLQAHTGQTQPHDGPTRAATREATPGAGFAAGIGQTLRQSRHEPQLQRSVQQAVHLAPPLEMPAEADGVNPPVPSAAPVPAGPQVAADWYPINLATALQLAGSSNLQVALAQERVRESYARLDGARALWIPNVSGGAAFTDHAGQIQNVEGRILEINRQSLFVGGGAGLGRNALTGGAGPPRMAIDLSPVDVIFEPLAARQTALRASADASAVFNDTMLQVAAAYLELVRAQAQVAIAHETITNTGELVQLTTDFARTGAGLRADAERAQIELAERERELLTAEERARVNSAELARLLRLDQRLTLHALDEQPLPIEVVREDVPLESLIAQGLQTRPEVRRQAAQIAAAGNRVSQERWRPWVPSLHMGASAGTFGGGRNSDFGEFSDRFDLDALAVWEVRNLGFGNRSLVQERNSQYRQACLALEAVRDQVSTDVTQAYHQSNLRRRQVPFAEQQITRALAALPLNFNGIRGGQLRPIEAQQAIAALAAARNRYVNAVIEHNQAQLALWRAIGHPPAPWAAMQTDSPDAVPAPQE